MILGHLREGESHEGRVSLPMLFSLSSSAKEGRLQYYSNNFLRRLLKLSLVFVLYKTKTKQYYICEINATCSLGKPSAKLQTLLALPELMECIC